MSSDVTVTARTRREPPAFRRVSVVRIEQLGAKMLRVVFGGDELAGFVIESPASSVRLLLPPVGAADIVIPTWTGNQFELPNGDRAPIRTFTPRYFDHAQLELTLDFVLHDQGVATDWARNAEEGDAAAISGPGRSEDLDASASSHLLVGDESALPAIGQLLEAIPATQSIAVHIEITDPTAQFELPAHPRSEVTWHVADTDAAPGDAMVAAVMALDELNESVWVAGHAAAVQRLRRYLFDERGCDRSDVTARGYWK